MTARVITVVGARPQFIKAAVISRAFALNSRISETIVHTGQHFDDAMSSVFFSELDIPAPAINLDIHGGGHGAMTGRMLEQLESILEARQPDAVLVYGDTNSTLAGALAAAKLHIPLFHVEAGLRSFNRTMPEEINRVLTDHVSNLLFCPTQTAVDNLSNEGITDDVHLVGDVMYDATLFSRGMVQEEGSWLQQLGVEPGKYVLCTLHRAENTDDEERFRKVFSFIQDVAKEQRVVFPVHPRTRQVLARNQVPTGDLLLIDPVGYFDMQRLLSGASLVLTDSGGVQKEAYFHRVPCVTLRDETEWVETIEAGWNRLWTTPGYNPRREIEDYGDGNSGERIVKIISDFVS